LRQKVKRVKTIVESDLGYNSSDDCKQRTTYLFVGHKRVIGMATAETIPKGFPLETLLERSTEGKKAMVGIHQLWVHAEHRKQGIATRLVDSVRSRFVFGLVVPVDMLAFSSPTEAGSRFARQYVASNSDDENSPVLVYDCK
jgi:N-acetyltransferase